MMAKYIAKRILLMIFLLLGMTFLVYGSMYLSPGDPAATLAGPNATVEEIEALRVALGLDKSFFTQYSIYITNLFKGDFGTSFTTRQPVLTELLVRLPNTMKLACAAMVFAIVVGIPAGLIAAIKKDSVIDNTVTTLSLAGISVPNFFLGIILMLVFAVKLKWFPAGGNNKDFWFVLPAIALGMQVAATFTRIGRSSMLDVLQSDYIRTARSKGLKEKTIIIVHALRNALIPILTVFGTSFGGLLGGAMVTEQVFAINGIGTYLINAINAHNYPAVQSTVVIIASFFIIVNLIVDLLYVVVDPRISYE